MNRRDMSAKIFLGQTTEGLPFLIQTLHDYKIVAADKMDRAIELMSEDGIDLFVLGVHFDESRCLELVNIIRTDERHRHTPIIVIRTLRSDYVDVLRQTMKLVSTLHGISDYLELETIEDRAATVRAAVERVLSQRRTVDK